MNQSNTNIAALLLRVTMGVMLIAHGLLKVMVFTLAGTAQFFEQVGFFAWMAYPVTFIEIIGGDLRNALDHFRIVDDDEFPGLTVVDGWRPACRFKNPVQMVFFQLPFLQAAAIHRTPADGIKCFHGSKTSVRYQ